jgi:hypothetical protein
MVDVIICEPPAAPIAKYRVLFSVKSMIIGVIEDNGRFPGTMKFAGEGRYPNALVSPGVEKSFISLFRMRPVRGKISCEPKPRLTVLVSETAISDASAVTMWDVPCLLKLFDRSSSTYKRLSFQDSQYRLGHKRKLVECVDLISWSESLPLFLLGSCGLGMHSHLL